jgi:hypothetical protein
MLNQHFVCDILYRLVTIQSAPLQNYMVQKALLFVFYSDPTIFFWVLYIALAPVFSEKRVI